MAIAPELNRASLSQQIRDSLFQRIVSGVFQPGDRIVEQTIAQEMKTSHAPIREALRELEAMGVVELQRNRGARVRTFGVQELREIYGVRAELEGYASEIVARIEPEISKSLETIMEDMVSAAKSVDRRHFATLNFDFHSTIIRATGNNTLAEIWEGLHVRSRTHMSESRGVADLIEVALAHRSIIAAIACGNPEQARKAAWEHVHNNMPERQTE